MNVKINGIVHKLETYNSTIGYSMLSMVACVAPIKNPKITYVGSTSGEVLPGERGPLEDNIEYTVVV
jgi:hypothetical protein